MGLESQREILVVDDDKFMGGMVGDLLHCGGFNPTVFDQSVLAVEALGKGKFNVLVTDLRMPKINGLELIDRATTLDPEMGVVLMTGTTEDLNGEIEALRRSGTCIELLPKPFDPETLLRMVNKVRQPFPMKV